MTPIEPGNDIQRISQLEAVFYSLMVGLGETYLVAFALSTGVSDASASYLAIIPVIIGSLLQFVVSARAMASRRKIIWMMVCSGGQAVTLLAMAALGFSGMRPLSPVLLAFLASLYWAFGFVAGPVWNTSIVHVIPKGSLKQFFYRRNAITHLFSLISFIIAAMVLGQLDTHSPRSAYLISILLTAAGISRLISMFCFAKHRFKDEMPHSAPPEQTLERSRTILKKENEPFSLNLPRELTNKTYVRAVLRYLFVSNLAVHVSGPFYTAYMLKELRLDFSGYCTLLGIAFISRILAGYLLNRWVSRFGVKFLLIVGAIGIAPVPFLWILSDNFIYLLGVQLLSGFAWGCQELGLTLSLIELVPHKQRSKLLTWSNLINALGMAAGVGIASLFIMRMGLIKPTYQMLFGLSAGLRAVAAIFAYRLNGSKKGRPIFFRMLGIRSSGAEIMKPILLPEDKELK